MPGNEQPHQSGDAGKGKEQEQEHRPPFVDVRRYPDMETAGRAYGEAQRALRRDAAISDISVYRIQVGKELTPHVIALGDQPGEQLAAKLEEAFALGVRATLDDDILQYLVARREAAKGLAPWVEQHNRPGEPVWLDRPQQQKQNREAQHEQKGQQGQHEGRRQRDQRDRHQQQTSRRNRGNRGSWKKKRH